MEYKIVKASTITYFQSQLTQSSQEGFRLVSVIYDTKEDEMIGFLERKIKSK